jgi:hypothetical protein
VSQSYLASGNITPSRLVKQDGSNTGQVLQCSANTDQPIGVAQAGTHLPNLTITGTSLDDGYAGIAVLSPPAIGAPTATDIVVYTVGDTCMVEVGAAVSNGDPLMSNSSGQGITGTSTNWSVGRAEMNATALGQLVRCLVQPMYYHT